MKSKISSTISKALKGLQLPIEQKNALSKLFIFINNKIQNIIDKLESSRALLFKGVLGTQPGMINKLPETYEAGWIYVVGTAGQYISNINCEIGDSIYAINSNENQSTVVASDWVIVQANIDGAVIYNDETGLPEEDIIPFMANNSRILKNSEISLSDLTALVKLNIKNGTGSYSIRLNSTSNTASGDNSVAEGERTTASGKGAHAEGGITKAIGNYSHSEGYYGVAEGDKSHVEGERNTASGQWSHAEGYNTTASGEGSHAEGSLTKALNPYSHAEGSSTKANGNQSHAEGWSTEAKGNQSHAEGYKTIANGSRSHTEGEQTTTTNMWEHAQGLMNVSNTGTSMSQKTLHSVGMGMSKEPYTNRNAHEIMCNGDHYVYGIGGYDGTNYSEAKTLQEVVGDCFSSISSDSDNENGMEVVFTAQEWDDSFTIPIATDTKPGLITSTEKQHLNNIISSLTANNSNLSDLETDADLNAVINKCNQILTCLRSMSVQ